MTRSCRIVCAAGLGVALIGLASCKKKEEPAPPPTSAAPAPVPAPAPPAFAVQGIERQKQPGHQLAVLVSLV